MSKELIEQIATQIVNEQILQNWKFYLILIALPFLASVASSFFISYFKARGKNFATKADIDGILQKIEDTETIKAQYLTILYINQREGTSLKSYSS